MLLKVVQRETSKPKIIAVIFETQKWKKVLKYILEAKITGRTYACEYLGTERRLKEWQMSLI